MPICNGDWPDHGIATICDGGTCTIDVCNSLVAAGAMAAAYVLKKDEMVGNGNILPKMLDPKVLQVVHGHPYSLPLVFFLPPSLY